MNDQYEIVVPKRKLIRHKWVRHIGFRSHRCPRCKTIRKYDPGFARLMYTDRFGHVFYHAPSCVLPNTKL